MKNIELSPAYARAVMTAALLQVAPLLLFAGFVPDGGLLATICLCAMATFWIGAGVIICRRPTRPSPSDLTFIHWGFLPVLIVGIAVACGVSP